MHVSSNQSCHDRSATSACGGIASRRCCLLRLTSIALPIFLPRLAQASAWPYEQRVDSLTYFADFNLGRYPELLDETQSLTRLIPETLALSASSEPIHLYLFGQQQTYRRYLGQYFPAVPYRRALFIKQRGPGMVFAYASEALATDLRHETTHAVLHTLLPMVPLWLDEGLAEYFETPAADRFAASPHLRPIQRNVRWWRAPSLEALESRQDLQEMDGDDYRDSWAWIHFFLHGPPEVRDEFRRYLADLHAHIPPGSLVRRLERRVPHLPREFSRHFAQQRPRG